MCKKWPFCILFWGTQGFRNDFKDALDKLDHEYIDQLARQEVPVCVVCMCVYCVCMCMCVLYVCRWVLCVCVCVVR